MDAGRRGARPCPRDTSHPIVALVFGWTWSLFRDGYKRDYSAQDLCDPFSGDQSQLLGDLLEKQWRRQLKESCSSKESPSLRRAIIAVFAGEYVKLGVLLFGHGVLMGVVQPLLLGQLLNYFQEPREGGKWFAYLNAAGIALSSGVNTVLYSHYTLGATRLGMRVRVACCSVLYRKALRLSQTSLGATPAGQVVNLLSNDVSRFEKVSMFLHYLWLSPLLSGIAACLMYVEVGWPSFVGFTTVVLTLPLQGYMSQLNAKFRSKTAYRTDARIRLIDDIVTGIRAIKMYTWEKPFMFLVDTARRREIDVLTLASYIRGLYMTLTLCSTRTAFFCTMVVMALFHERLTIRKIFVLQSYFNVLAHAVSMSLVRGMAEVAEVFVSITRLQEFMLLQEISEETQRKTSLVLKPTIGEDNEQTLQKEVFTSHNDEFAVIMKEVTAKWESQYIEPTLYDVNVCFNEGTLAVIVGPVGSGKSSLLQAILGELPTTKGTILLNGTVSYASQEPWVFAATVRQNILFGQPYERIRYEEVIRACVLDGDLARFPEGDLTVVGDQGVSLSGGQRARINLARAVYKQADVYLLDDPLASLDSYVAQDLFEKCISKFLAKKTRILVTNHLQYVQKPEVIVVMDNSNAVVLQDDLKRRSFLNNSRILSSISSESSDDESFEQQMSPKISREDDDIGWSSFDMMEASSKGKIHGKSVYKEYLRRGSNTCVNVVIFLLFIITQLLVCAIDYFVSLWTTQDELKAKQDSTIYNESIFINSSIDNEILYRSENQEVLMSLELCIIIYSSLIIALFVFAITRSLAFYKVCMNCSRKLHENMFQSIVRAKVYFFDANPTGRILNRFSKDMGAIDEVLPRTMLNAQQIIMQMIGCIVVSVIVNYYFIIPVVIIGAIFWISRRIYLKTSKNLKRVEGMTKSPVFTHFHATMKGLSTVRAYGAQTVLSTEFDNHQDLHTSAWFTFLSTSIAFGFFLDSFVSIFIAVVTLGSLALEGKFTGVFGSHPGLAITQSMSLSGMLQWGVRQTAEVANNMMSVERVIEYSCVEPEKNPEGSDAPNEWPEFGMIEFENVYVKYNERDPPVIRDVNLIITPGQKVGIVGRTGAGKSSLVSALFRTSWAIEGHVIIDGVDTRFVSLQELRRKISVIPQEPLMFAGTMRNNLDPFAEYSDSQLLQSLQEVELKDALQVPHGLDTRVAEGGRNFSVGQRQLVCLARAILKENKILVMDEATANVDHNTDTLIQKTIRIKFKHCTVLTVAHRLESVMDYDKIIVVDAGQVVEFDHPHLLLQKPEGYFYKMVTEHSSNVTNRLSVKARESYERKWQR